MLEVSELSRSYGDFVAVRPVSFAIESGEITGLLGHNGAGKTTIMKMLAGHLEPDRGQIIIDGIDLAENAKAVQQRLGYLPENLPVYPELSVADYLDYAAELKGLTGRHKWQAIKRAVAATEIGPKLLAPINTLSRGYKQRVGIAQAILGQPKLLILDEPTNGLDPTQTQHIRQLIRSVAESATVILSTHIMQEVEALCHRVLIVNQGELAVNSRLDALRAGRRLRVATSLNPSKFEQAAGLPGVAAIEALAEPPAGFGQGEVYALRLTDGANIDAVAANLADALTRNGAQLYRLDVEQRDLESLFNQAHQATEVNAHAA